MNFLMMIGTVQYWTRFFVALISAAAISLDTFHRRIRTAQGTVLRADSHGRNDA